MKKLLIIAFITGGIIFAGCSDVKKHPGRTYMPDMAYSRAYETYALTEEQRKELEKNGIHYTGVPVAGTIKRGIDYTFRLPQDFAGDSTNYVASKQIKNPMMSVDSIRMKEAERLYLINCAICHGTALDGNGPLFKNGDGPYPSKPANFAGDPKYVSMPEGQMYYSVTYGKNMMGSYASQLDANQRWMVIAYIKDRQNKLVNAAGGTPDAGKEGAGGNKDSSAVKK